MKKTDVILFRLSAVSFLLMSASMLLMPVDASGSDGFAWNIFAGVVFWLFLVLGLILQGILELHRRKWFSLHPNKRERHRKIGLIVFFQNRLAQVADIAFALSLAALMITVVFFTTTGYICYIFAALMVFSFCMHCMLNGRICAYVFSARTRRNAINSDTTTEAE